MKCFTPTELAPLEASRAALIELVELQDLKDWLKSPGSADAKFKGHEFECGEAAAEYRRRLPLAWDAARAAVAK